MANTTLVLRLLARTSAFEHGINRSRKHIRSLDMSVTGMARRLKTLAGAALAVAGVGGLGYLVKRTMESIDATAKLSDRLGMATEKLIGLQHGAKIAGTNQETLNKSLEIFSRRLGEVDMGVGEAKHSLDKLGISYHDLIEKSPDQAIAIVADQVAGLKTQSEKAAAMNYLFGRSGQQLLNLFAQGSAGLAQYQAEVERLGLTFSRFDASQVEAANDAMTRMRAVGTGLLQEVVIQLAPYIESAAEAMTDLMTGGFNAGEAVGGAFETMATGAMTLAEKLVDIEIGLLRIKNIGREKITSVLTKAMIDKHALERYRIISGDTLAGKPRGLMTLSTPQQRYPAKDPALLESITQQLTRENMPDIKSEALREAEALKASLQSQKSAIAAAFASIGQRSQQHKWDQATGGGLGVLPGWAGAIPADLFPKGSVGGAATPEPPTIVDEKAAESVQKTTAALEQQLRVLELVNAGKAKNVQIASFMIQAEQAYGEGTSAVADMVGRYTTALDTLTAAQEKQLAAEKAAQEQIQAAEQAATSRREAVADVDRILTGMRMELDMVGKVGESWHRSREYAELYATLIEASAGNAI